MDVSCVSLYISASADAFVTDVRVLRAMIEYAVMMKSTRFVRVLMIVYGGRGNSRITLIGDTLR